MRGDLVGDPDDARHIDEEKIFPKETRQASNFLSTLKDFFLFVLSGELDEIMPIDDIKEFCYQAK